MIYFCTDDVAQILRFEHFDESSKIENLEIQFDGQGYIDLEDAVVLSRECFSLRMMQWQ